MATFDGTTLTRVRRAIFKDATDETHDDLLGQLITTASRQVEKWLNAPFSAESRVETFTIDDGRRSKLFLDAAPVSAVASLKYDGTSAFSGSETTLDATSYALEPDAGVLHLRFEPSVGFQVYRVTYTGGLAADTPGLIADFPDIAQAIDMQVAYLFHIGDRPHVVQESLGGAAIKSSEPGGLCQRARDVCAHHRRWTF